MRAVPRTFCAVAVPDVGTAMVAMDGSSEVQMIGVLGTVTPFRSTATAVKLNEFPATALPLRGEICTPTAFAPGPVYETGIVTGGGGGVPGDDGVAVTATGPPLNTVSPAALTYPRFSVSGSPLVGASGSSFTSSETVSESAPDGNAIVVSSATVPSE